jgi:hypothetical protein
VYQRVTRIVVLTIGVYTLFMSFALAVRGQLGAVEFGGHILAGMMLGGMAVHLSDNESGRLWLTDLVVLVLFQMALGVLFGLFTLRGQWIFAYADLVGQVTLDYAGLSGYLGRLAGLGVLLGGMFWLCGGVVGLLRVEAIRQHLLGLVGVFIVMFGTPFLAELAYRGAVFVVVAVGVRLIGGVVMPYLPDTVQGYLFGLWAGLTVTLLPFIGYNGYGAF